MKRLFLDTSNKYLYICVLDNNEVIFSHIQEGNNNHSETLMDKVKELFDKYHLNIQKIDEIYVGKGPGSYTGVRVACTISKVLAYALNIKLFSFSSLDLLLTTKIGKGTFKVVMDARRGFSYAKVVKVDEKVNIVLDEVYIETTKLNEKYPDCTLVNIDDIYTDKLNYDVLKLLEFNLVEEVKDVHAFVPTYLRSGV